MFASGTEIPVFSYILIAFKYIFQNMIKYIHERPAIKSQYLEKIKNFSKIKWQHKKALGEISKPTQENVELVMIWHRCIRLIITQNSEYDIA